MAQFNTKQIMLIGLKGNTGDTGATGATGSDGAEGVSITGVTIDENGNLIITLSNGTTQNAGNIVNMVLAALPNGDGVSY